MKRFDLFKNEGGKQVMRNRKEFAENVDKIIESGKKPFVLLCYEGEKRSNKFNRFYFGTIVKRMAKLVGETQDRTHDMIKAHILGEEVYKGFDGKMRGRPKRTRNMSTEEFQAFVDSAEALAVEMGVDLTDIQESTRALRVA